ncbi:MAG: ABC transporter permease [Dehalococcoidia bacterium]
MFAPIVRTLSLLDQWWAEVIRQPTLMFTLIIAPFLLLFAFGEGVELGGPRPETVIVHSPDAEDEVDRLLQRIDQSVELVGRETSLPLAERSLARGDIHAVIIVPDDVEGYLERGEQVPVRVLIGEIDPVRRSYAQAYMRDQIATLNQQAVTEAIAEAQGALGDVSDLTASAQEYADFVSEARSDVASAREQVRDLRDAIEPLSMAVSRLDQATSRAAFALPALAPARERTTALRQDIEQLETEVRELDERLQAQGDDGLPTDEDLAQIETSLAGIEVAVGDLSAMPPEVMSAPFALQMEDLTPVPTSFTTFYAPAVVALLIQHLAITLGALTMARMRLLRVTEMLRVAPIRPVEVVTGSYLSYLLLAGLAAAGLLALMVFVLDVPVLGAQAWVAAIVGLLILCSLGIGFVVSLLSSTVQQAVQVSMLILLGAIFFSGFAFTLDQIQMPVRALSYLFPASYGVRSLQDVMLRGILRHPEDIVILGVGALAFFAATVWLMRRELRVQ